MATTVWSELALKVRKIASGPVWPFLVMILCAVNGRSNVMSKYSVNFCGPTFLVSSLQKLPLVMEPDTSSGPSVETCVAIVFQLAAPAA